MANTITVTQINNGAEHLDVLVNILGDGSGEESSTVLIDRSTFAPTDGTKLIVDEIAGYLVGFRATLSFDATADLPFVRLPADDSFKFRWCEMGGVSSTKAGAGATGDILITTSSLGNGDAGTFILRMRKR